MFYYIIFAAACRHFNLFYFDFSIFIYRCKCEIGLCGPDCILSDPCQQTTVNICQNGGECTENCSDVSDYMCLCIDGYIGRNCTEVVWFFFVIIIIYGYILLHLFFSKFSFSICLV